ncbi:MAG: hypothetical protein Q8M03_04590 [Legionella sp.]|nr:hypothetical protein [Legionella sp.]
MPRFTKDDLLTMTNPYQRLIDEDNLAENCAAVDTLALEEKTALATRIILGCPADKRANLYNTIQEQQQGEEANYGFVDTLKNALKVRQSIHAMAGSHPSPQSFLLDHRLNYTQFSGLVSALLDEETSQTIASNLVTLAPAESLSTLKETIDSHFAGTTLPHQMSNALLVNELLDVLRAGSPLNFFDAPIFRPLLFLTFPSLVAARLKDNELHIASRLASEPCWQHRLIQAKLLMISGTCAEPTHFRLIYDQFSSAIVLEELPMDSNQPIQNPAGNQNSNQDLLTTIPTSSTINRYRFHHSHSEVILGVRRDDSDPVNHSNTSPYTGDL